MYRSRGSGHLAQLIIQLAIKIISDGKNQEGYGVPVDGLYPSSVFLKPNRAGINMKSAMNPATTHPAIKTIRLNPGAGSVATAGKMP